MDDATNSTQADPLQASADGGAALASAEDRILAAILYQQTGDAKWIGEPYRTLLPYPDKLQATIGVANVVRPPPDEAGLAELRAELHGEIGRLIDAGARPGADRISEELVSFVLGQGLPASYTDLLRESFDFDAPGRRPPGNRFPDAPEITIVGGGYCGLTMAIRLTEMGIPYTLLEKHADIGGVWYENAYPGAAVDTTTFIYSFASAIESDWTRFHSERDEILGYMTRTIQRLKVREHVRCNSHVRSMIWSESDHQWILTVETPEGTREHRSDIVISALGTLNQPKYPQISGIERFRGPCFHTSRWRHDVELSGKRVGMIGNGSSGFQVGPHVAGCAAHLTSFQRSPAWTGPNPLANMKVPEGLKWLLREVPGYGRWHRFVMYWHTGDAGFDRLRRDPDWSGPGVSKSNEETRQQLTEYICGQLGKRQDLIDKLVPRYPPYTKRLVVDNGWLKTLTRPNVSLVTEPITAADESGLITADGAHHPLDVLIYATGFHGTRFLWPTEVRGRDGRTPAEIAGQDDNIRAYLGLAMPGFPNFFSLFGPNSSIGHGGGATHIAQCQADYIGQCLEMMLEQGIKTVECKQGVCDAYNRKVDAGLQKMVWSEPGIASRYRNREGRIVSNHPWTLQEFWELTRNVDLDDYVATPGTLA